MNGEVWIWTELLAFDRNLQDFGVEAYLQKAGQKPTGISLLSGFDFILCHDNLEREIVMSENVCSRAGHLSNGMRTRQAWTNFEIRKLVKELRKYGIKVLISVFENGFPETFSQEFRYRNCPEHRYSFVGKLNDGRNDGEFFIAQLLKVMRDYGFDGFHAADGIAADWLITSHPTDQVIRAFAFAHPRLTLPEFIFEDASTPETDEKRLRKLEYLHRNCWQIWNQWLLDAWMNFWRKAVNAIHDAGKIIMVNSPNTKSVFGALQYMSLDYRELAELKIDYLLCETTSSACALIWHGRPYIHEFDAVISEMSAAMPGVKVLIMPAVKDVVETYDALEHAPSLYERDLYLQTAQHIVLNGQLKRCADGLMVCLGDCIEAHEWRMLNELYDSAFRFQAVKTGELVWLHDSAMFDAMQAEHHQCGTWSPSQQVNELRNLRAIDISTIADIAELPHLSQPVIAFDFHLWSPEKQSAVLKLSCPVILTGFFSECELPEGAEVIRWQNQSRAWCAVFRNWSKSEPGILDIPSQPEPEAFDDFKRFNIYREFYPHLAIPPEFWQKTADRIRALLGALPLQNECDGLQLVRQFAAGGSELVLVTSTRNYYTIPRLTMSKTDASITVQSRFPKVPVGIRNGVLDIADSAQQFPLHIPPMGVLAFQINPDSKESIAR